MKKPVLLGVALIALVCAGILVYAISREWFAQGAHVASTAGEHKPHETVSIKTLEARFKNAAGLLAADRKEPEIEAAARKLADGHRSLPASALADFLRRQLSQPEPREGYKAFCIWIARQKLALWMLGYIGTRECMEVLQAYAIEAKSKYPPAALSAMSVSPRAEARKGLEAVLTNRKSRPGVVAMAANFLRALGDTESLGLIVKRVETTADESRKQELRTSVANLRYRLSLAEKERLEYEAFELTFWRAVIAAPVTSHASGPWWSAARAIEAGCATVPLRLVARKLKHDLATDEEASTAACLCALMDEEKATELVRQMVAAGKGRPGYTAARHALISIEAREEARKKAGK
jgi:hypothetical protein